MRIHKRERQALVAEFIADLKARVTLTPDMEAALDRDITDRFKALDRERYRREQLAKGRTVTPRK